MLELPRVQDESGRWIDAKAPLISDHDLDRYAKELSAILDHVRHLETLDLTAVAPTSHGVPLATRLRDDVVEGELSLDEALDQAPQRVGDGFAVPKVIE